MKTLLALLLFTLTASAQTNTITAKMSAAAKQKASCPANYWYVGQAQYLAPSTNPPNTWFFPTTNVHSMTCTNPSADVQWAGQFGNSGCGRGSLVWTDSVFPTEPVRFSVLWSNNVPVPTNLFVPLTITGFITNSP